VSSSAATLLNSFVLFRHKKLISKDEADDTTLCGTSHFLSSSNFDHMNVFSLPGISYFSGPMLKRVLDVSNEFNDDDDIAFALSNTY